MRVVALQRVLLRVVICKEMVMDNITVEHALCLLAQNSSRIATALETLANAVVSDDGKALIHIEDNGHQWLPTFNLKQ
jgi:hypothetical protein